MDPDLLERYRNFVSPEANSLKMQGVDEDIMACGSPTREYQRRGSLSIIEPRPLSVLCLKPQTPLFYNLQQSNNSSLVCFKPAVQTIGWVWSGVLGSFL